MGKTISLTALKANLPQGTPVFALGRRQWLPSSSRWYRDYAVTLCPHKSASGCTFSYAVTSRRGKQGDKQGKPISHSGRSKTKIRNPASPVIARLKPGRLVPPKPWRRGKQSRDRFTRIIVRDDKPINISSPFNPAMRPEVGRAA